MSNSRDRRRITQRCVVVSILLHGLALAGAARLHTAGAIHASERNTSAIEEDIPTFELDLRGTGALVTLDSAGEEGTDAPAPGAEAIPEAELVSTVPLPPFDMELPPVAEVDPPEIPTPTVEEAAVVADEIPVAEPLIADAPPVSVEALSANAPAPRESASAPARAFSDRAPRAHAAFAATIAGFAASRITDPRGTGHGAGRGEESASSTTAGPPGGRAFAPRPIAMESPSYPRECSRRGIEGRTLCRMHVNAAGKVERVDIVESSGHDALDRAAQTALKRWRFEPPTRDGRPIASFVLHWVTFRLR